MNQGPMTEMLDGHFKFKPGDICCTRVALNSWKVEAELNGTHDRYAGRIGSPAAVTVLTRRLEQCHGGVQGFYGVRFAADPALVVVMDHELVAYDEVLDVARAMKSQEK